MLQRRIRKKPLRKVPRAEAHMPDHVAEYFGAHVASYFHFYNTMTRCSERSERSGPGWVALGFGFNLRLEESPFHSQKMRCKTINSTKFLLTSPIHCRWLIIPGLISLIFPFVRVHFGPEKAALSGPRAPNCTALIYAGPALWYWSSRGRVWGTLKKGSKSVTSEEQQELKATDWETLEGCTSIFLTSNMGSGIMVVVICQLLRILRIF